MYLKNRKGFTLLELILVILILGIILAIALPGFQRPLAHHRLYAAGREMVSEIRQLQQRALAEEKHSYKIKFFVDRSRNIKIDHYYIMEDINILKTVELPAGINLYDTNFAGEKLHINCSGYPAYGFGGTVQLENDHNEKLYIIVAKTGRVRMDDKPPAESKYN